MTRYLSLAEFWYLAEHVTGINAATLIKASRVELADSALHAPQAGFGNTDFYPDVYDKAGVLACRIAWNHPLPDGNKRAAWACLVLFIDLNAGHGMTSIPTSRTLSRQCSQLRHIVRSTKPGSLTGFANESPFEPERRMPPNNPEPERSSSRCIAGELCRQGAPSGSPRMPEVRAPGSVTEVPHQDATAVHGHESLSAVVSPTLVHSTQSA